MISNSKEEVKRGAKQKYTKLFFIWTAAWCAPIVD